MLTLIGVQSCFITSIFIGAAYLNPNLLLSQDIFIWFTTPLPYPTSNSIWLKKKNNRSPLCFWSTLPTAAHVCLRQINNHKSIPCRPPTQLSSAPSSAPFFFLGGANKQSIASFRPSVHTHTPATSRLSTRASREIYHLDQLLIFARETEYHSLEGQGASHGRGRLSARFFTTNPRILLGSRPIVQPTDHLPPVTKFHQKIFHQHFSSNTTRNLPSLLSYSYWTKRVFYILKPEKKPKKIWHVRFFFSSLFKARNFYEISLFFFFGM